MFQSFEIKSARETVAPRVAELRAAMAAAGVDAFLVPHADEYQNEYLAPCAERLAWISGFTGSAGFAIITQAQGVLFVDGRYTLQAANQTDPAVCSIESLVDCPPERWLEQNATKGTKIGFDPALVTLAGFVRLEAAAKKAGASLTACANLIDAVWTDRMPEPLGKIAIHKLKHAGERAREKLARLSQEIAKSGADFCLLADPASVAWAFNIRGNDMAHTPLALSRAIIRASGEPLIFIDAKKLNRETDAYLTQLAKRFDPTELPAQMAALSRGAKAMLDPERASALIGDMVEKSGGTILKRRDPVVLPRAIKNEAEIEGSHAAHLRDGVALTRFLAWLDRQAAGTLDEISAASSLEQFRAQTAKDMGSELLDISFDTISGAGPNGAIVHYRVDTSSNRKLEPDSVFLIDSGAQYRDGTTDITRTVAIGKPPALACTDFTLVLKGHIAIATAAFPVGTRGVELDSLARIALWKTGRDYAHGTGHGIGSFLAVHEGPQSISKRGMEPLLPGMIVSNEPGYYREGQWGIRIENLVLVKPAQLLEGGNVPVHSFETLSLAPIDRRLIDTALMTREELVWLDGYHRRVEEALSPHLDAADRAWLKAACAGL